MVPRRRGALLFTGASASVKGYPLSAAFAMGKFALRGLAQSAARELGPEGIQVAHIVIDGGVRSASRPDPQDRPDRSWSMRVEFRPWVETVRSSGARRLTQVPHADRHGRM